MLARVAVLCNEWNPDSVAPYGGEGELTRDNNAPAVFRATFANTTDEQWLNLLPLSACSSSRTGESSRNKKEPGAKTGRKQENAAPNDDRDNLSPG